jgi:hypothetical protein
VRRIERRGVERRRGGRGVGIDSIMKENKYK